MSEESALAAPSAPALMEEEPVPAAAEGSAGDVDPAAAGGDAAPAALSASERRRSRWGGKKEDEGAPATPPNGAEEPAKKRSRWGSKPSAAPASAQPADPLLMAVQMGIPLATLQHMNAKQQEMLPSIKARMDEIDVLLRLPDIMAQTKASSECLAEVARVLGASAGGADVTLLDFMESKAAQWYEK